MYLIVKGIGGSLGKSIPMKTQSSFVMNVSRGKQQMREVIDTNTVELTPPLDHPGCVVFRE